MSGKDRLHPNHERYFFWGRPLAPLYSCLMANRSSLYRRGFFRQHKLEVPVISVGNLVLGGTGKTPLVVYLAEFLRKHEKKPAVLSRGYKGAASGPVNVVSDENSVLLDAATAGDEPRLLAEKLPGTPVITGRKRSVTGRFALEAFGVDHIILDDGFQHLSLKRDLDLVLFSSRKLLGNGRVLPGGELREPLSALKRADAFVLTGNIQPGDEKIAEFIRFLAARFPGKPLFTGSYMPADTLSRTFSGRDDILSLAEGREIPVFGFCGIANPGSFHHTLREAGLKLVGFRAFADHHAYTRDDILELCRHGSSAGAHALIATEKDLVKIRDRFQPELPLLTLPVRLKMNSDFDLYLRRKLECL